MKLKLLVGLMLVVGYGYSEPVVHKFEAWNLIPQGGKKFLYNGWTNGFFVSRNAGAFAFARCLESISADQAVAMIDKYYKDHPKKWSEVLGGQIIEALTVQGSPCEGKKPPQ